MAITRQDYQYIRNTLPSGISKSSDGTLTIGETVTNLVPELSEKNLYNPNYTDYYGTDKESKLTKVWYCPLEGEKYNTITFTPKSTDLTKTEIPETHSILVQGTTGRIAQWKDGVAQYLAQVDIIIDTKAQNISVMNGRQVSFNSSTGEMRVEIYSDLPNSLARGTVSYTLSSFVYSIDVAYSLKDHGVSSDVIALINEDKVKVSSSYLVGDLPYAERTDDDLIVYFSLAGWTNQITASIMYTTEVKYLLKDTIKNGLLSTQVSLEANTSYVLQVIDAITPKDATFLNNISSQTSSVNFDFNQYVFFHTGENAEVFDVNIFGISFGYKMYHLKTEGDKSTLLQLRNITSPVEAKVFLFKADLPWVVNKKGIIVGLNNTSLQIPVTTGEEAQSGVLTDQEVYSIFKTAPELGVEDDKLIVWLPGAGTNTPTWKYKTLWNKTQEAENKPEIADEVKLLFLRDYLTNEIREYKLTKNEPENEITRKHGIIRTIQKNQHSKKDKYSIDTNEYIGFNKIAQYPLSSVGDEKYITLGFDDDVSTSDEGVKTLLVDPRELIPISLPLLSLLGYNRTYCKEQGLFDNSEINPYQYTSVCVAWGRLRDYESYEIISSVSKPILVDRGLISKIEKDGGDIILTLKNAGVVKEKVAYYGGKEVICIRELETEQAVVEETE